ncbi:MAG: hypothetical protein RIS00_1632, partial [Pseudomonadota bacterium]
MKTCFALTITLLISTPAAANASPPPSISRVDELAAQQAKGLSSEEIVRQYLTRIAAIDDAGPRLNAVIATFPDAIEQARRLDAERKAGKIRGPLHGIPVLVK